MKPRAIILSALCLLSLSAYTQNSELAFNYTENHEIDQDAMTWELSYDFMKTETGTRQGTCILPVNPCYDLIIQGTNTGCGTTVDYPNFWPDCPEISMQCIPPSGSFFLPGTTTVVCMGTTTTSNVSCTFDVYVVGENQPPTILCPSDITLNNNSGTCGAALTWADPLAIDNCGIQFVTCSPPSGSTFPLGTSVVTCMTRDVYNNMATCTFNVTVVDDDPPLLICPNDVITSAAPGACDAVVTWAGPLAMDNCSNVTTFCDIPSGSSFPIGTTLVTCVGVDAASNAWTCQFSVEVIGECSENCPQDILLNNTVTTGLYHAENKVSTMNTTTGTNTMFKAGNLIELLNNFSAPGNTDFSAEIEDCIPNVGVGNN